MHAAVRLGFVVAGMGVVGWRLLAAARDWREWHLALGSDPSAADAWRTFFCVNLGSAAAAFAGILLFLAILRRLDRRSR